MARWALPLALLLLAPAVAAQVPQLPPLPVPGPGGPGAGTTDVRLTLQLQDPGAPLVPTRPYALVLAIAYQYGPGGNVPPEPDLAPSGQVCGEVTVPAPPPWANVTVTPSTVCFTINPTFAVGGTEVTNQTIVEINVTDGAPALEPFNFTVQASTPAHGTLRGAEAETSRVIMPSFIGRLAIRAPPSHVVQGGRTELVPLVVQNLGNGPIEVRFTNVSAPQGLRVTLPGRFVIATPGDEATVHLQVLAPWTAPVRGQVDVQAESAHPSRPDMLGDTPRARLDVVGRAAVPGAEPMLGALALAGLALVLRRRGA